VGADVDVILFDFGGTLAEEVDSLFLTSDDVPPSWLDLWNARLAEPGFVDSWERGAVSATQLIDALAHRFGTETEVVRNYIQNRCRNIRFYAGIMRAVAARKRRGSAQAIVTVNPDLFAEIAEHYALDELFDTIVLSAREGTTDKVELCRIALDRLETQDVSSALLIDNNLEHVRAFERVGGTGYQFIDDAAFLADVTAGRLPPSLAS
jgi:FMN phosphatase YigB (HAD superfamily)